MKKPSSNRAKFTINCVLLYWRHLPARLLYNDFGKIRVSLILGVKSYMHFFLLVFPPIFSKFDNQHNNKVKKGLKSCYAKRLIYLIGIRKKTSISKCSHFFLVEVIYFLHCRHKSRALRTAIAPQYEYTVLH